MILHINVRVSAASATTLDVTPIDGQADCPRCQAGQGCGAMPWFRGLYRDRSTLRVAQTYPPLSKGDMARLSIASGTVNRLSLFTYAVPLSAFIAALWLCQPLTAEWLQLCIALATMSASFLTTRRYRHHLLYRALKIEPLSKHPQPIMTGMTGRI